MNDAAGTGIVRGEALTVLERVREAAVGLALWQRAVPIEIARALDALPESALPSGRVLVPIAYLDAALAAMMKTVVANPIGGFLRADIGTLARLYSLIAGTDLIDLRLDAIRHDACWRFHRDNTRLRLICTYRGPGTQIVPAAMAETALGAQRDYHGPLEELPRFSAAVFKGSRIAGENGVVHRSPPIAGTGTCRLVLCLNERSEASPPLWTL